MILTFDLEEGWLGRINVDIDEKIPAIHSRFKLYIDSSNRLHIFELSILTPLVLS